MIGTTWLAYFEGNARSDCAPGFRHGTIRASDRDLVGVGWNGLP